MLIGVDAGCLGIKDERLKVGVYQVAKNLLEGLGKIDKKNKYLLYSFYPIEKQLMGKLGCSMKNVVVRPARGWSRIWLPLRILKDKPNIFLALNQSLIKKFPFSPIAPYTIGFIYDLSFEKFPKMYPSSFEKLRKNSKEVAEKSDILITISNSTKRDLIDLYSAESKKIKVVYPGISKKFNAHLKKNYSDPPYFLFVGAIKPIKNVSIIIKAFSYFVEKSKKEYKLYLAGGDKWYDKNVDKVLKDLSVDVRKKIKFLGFVTDSNLVKLYNGATAFVSPSFYEGFGLTFLEAMACGCPVIGSNKGSLPEVVGDAGLLVEPDNHKEIGEAMIKLAKDKKLREDYIKKGFKRIRKFSWEKFTKEVFKLITQYY